MKRNWFVQILILSLVLVFTLSACTNEGGESEGYPAPGESGYPSSQADPGQPVSAPAVLYPDLADGNEISWIQAVAMVNNGEVASIMQTHDLKVSLTLKDGRTFHTTEPAIDLIIQVVEACGDPCKNIAVATE